MEENVITHTETTNNLIECENCSKGSLDLHLTSLKAKHSTLEDEKTKLEVDFSIQRAKMKELFLQKEVELKLKTEENDANILEIQALNSNIKKLQIDLDEARSQVTIAQCTAENDLEIEKRKFEEEIASVQQILREKINELRVRLKNSEKETLHYRDLYEKIIEDSELKKDSILSPGVLSSVTKSLAKKVTGLSPSHSPQSTLSEKLGGTNSGLNSFNSTLNTASTVESVENLEESMRKAQEDTAMLQSLVLPLEEEIKALKDKIREQDTELRMYKSQEQIGLKTSEVIAPLMEGKSPEQLVQELDEKLKGVRNNLEMEKESRADLELYSAILNTQKSVLSDSVDELKSQLSELKQLYDNEKKENFDLKHSWQRVNDQLLEVERLRLADLMKIRHILNTDQLRKFNEIQHSIASNKEETEEDMREGKACQKFNIEESASQASLLESSSDKCASPEEPEPKGSSDDTVSSIIDSSEDNEASEVTPEEGVIGKISSEALISKYCPGKMLQLTDDQKKALSEISEHQGSGVDFIKTSPNDAEIDNLASTSTTQRVVSESEWRKLQTEIQENRARITETCPLCAKLETDLRKVQNDFKDCEKERLKLDEAYKRQFQDLERETLYRKKTEHQWKEKAEAYDKKEKDVQVLVEKVTKKYSQMLSWSRRKIIELDDKLQILSNDRKNVQAELNRLQSENDILVAKHSQHSQEMQNEIINLPDTMEEMQLLLLKYREDLIAAKVAKEMSEEKVSSKVHYLKEQLAGSLNERKSMADALNDQNEELRRKHEGLEKKSKQLEAAKRDKIEAETRVGDLEKKMMETESQSQKQLNSLLSEIEEQNQNKAHLESEVSEYKAKISALQHDLKMSEDVQRDFVRLSQSLQVQLEKIRQSEKEVRWQHEDDVEDCNNCKYKFIPKGKRKSHCRHCGKVFCIDCLTKTVVSGPNNRASRVCDVCHTLLVQDATPFFSRNPPQSID